MGHNTSCPELFLSLFIPAILCPVETSTMLPFAILFASFAAGAHSQFLSAPTGLTTTKGFAGYNVRWKEVPTGPDGICELVGALGEHCVTFDIALPWSMTNASVFRTLK